MARSARKPSRAEARAALVAAAEAVELPERCDVAVIGGGAAGLVAAICAAEAGASAVVLERELECGRTILATGNGRCNFANASLGGSAPAWGAYNDPAFVEAVCGASFLDEVLAFFEDSGLAWAVEDGRYYPLSRQAASVRDVLLARARRAGVVLAPGREARYDKRSCSVCHIGVHMTNGTGAFVISGGGPAATAVVWAAGGQRGEGEPVLCPLACEAPEGLELAELDGRRAHATLRLLRGGRAVAEESGEVLFRSYGLSGIAVFNMSRLAEPGDVLALDLTCGLPADRAARAAEKAEGLAGLLDPVIARALHDDLNSARDLHFVVIGPADAEHAQVTRGGLATAGFDPATLASRTEPGLFACGEALDVDGACGGFNLAWAWKSGMIAGRAAAAYAKEARC